MVDVESKGASDTLAPTGRRPFRWGFLSASALILALVVAGHVALSVLGRIVDGQASGLQIAAFAGFLLAAALFVILQSAAVLRFFRTMQVGVSLVGLSLLAVALGVLVPQITNFEDPTERVPDIADIPAEVVEAYVPAPKTKSDEVFRARPDDHPALAGLTADQVARIKRWKNEYAAFRWAEGFFVYHMLHLYGIGMPEAALPPGIGAKLDIFQDRYGIEERQNREKQMTAAFTGQQKSREIGQLIRENERLFRRAFQVCTALELNRAYKSNWFAALLGLLAAGVLLNTFKGAPASWFTLRKGGYMLVHLGVLTMLAGGVYSKLKTDRGILHLMLGQPPRDVYDGFHDPSKPRVMPFALSLEQFARRDWKTLEVGFFDDDLRSMPPQYTLWPGRKVQLDFADEGGGRKRPRIQVEVLEVHERALVGAPRWWDAEDPDDPDGLGPLAILSTLDRAAVAAASQEGAEPVLRERSVFLTPDPRMPPYLDPAWKFRLAVAHARTPTEIRALVEPEHDGRVAWLSMRVAAAGDVEPLVVPVRIGETVAGPAGYRLSVVSAAGDLRFDPQTKSEILDPRPLAEQFPANPGIVVEIRHQDGGAPERRIVAESFDAEARGMQKEFAFPDLALNLEWERWTSPGPPRYVLAFERGAGAVLHGQDGSRVPVKAGEALPLPGGTRVTVRELLANVRFETPIEFDPAADFIKGPQYDEHFYSTDPTGVVLRVTTEPGRPEETTRVLRLASTDTGRANVWQSKDRRFWLRYFENSSAMPFEWRSVLKVHERGPGGAWRQVDTGGPREREIRVNDYFVHRGYRFFQTNADARSPTYSGIGVVYDPGIPYVMYGMWLTICGAVVAFVLRPIAEARAKRRRAAA
ncbi:MAG: hypothetical protein JNK02_00335 [Planctomycetes bacterium]|nr:hypothetical protein [Planctomycetota bacterium]